MCSAYDIGIYRNPRTGSAEVTGSHAVDHQLLLQFMPEFVNSINRQPAGIVGNGNDVQTGVGSVNKLGDGWRTEE